MIKEDIVFGNGWMLIFPPSTNPTSLPFSLWDFAIRGKGKPVIYLPALNVLHYGTSP
jgi:hypothetical protein